MKRIKRFVLAETAEKDPNWKSSDNLLARASKSNVLKNDEENARPKEEEKEKEGSNESGAKHYTTSEFM